MTTDLSRKKFFNHKGWATMLLLLVALAVGSCRVAKKTETKSYYRQAIQQAETILSQAKDEIMTPAISVAVGMDNRIVWAAARGYKNIERQEPADTTTQFRIGSSSKAVTSMALGKLLQQNLVQLDDPIQSYLSFLDPFYPSITIRQLAAHTSGIRNYKNNEFNSNVQFGSIRESVDVFIHDSLLFQPGTRFSYSTYNYTVLSAVFEQVTKTEFLPFMSKEVFVPLQMYHTVGDDKTKDIVGRAQFYNFQKQDSTFKKAIEVNNSNKWAGGGLLSTPSDLVKLGNSLLNHTFLTARTIAILTEPQKLTNGKINGLNYALGWKNDTARLFQQSQNVQQIHHGGSAGGGTCMLVMFPAYNLSISMVINRDGYASADLFKYIYPIAEAFITEKRYANSVRNRMSD
ncbi:serine hydrolase domain-containing protein [Spirosoma gilvum]